MTTVDFENGIKLGKLTNLDIYCRSCNRSNSLLEAARLDTKFEFELKAEQWVRITRALTSSLNSMQKAADKSEAVSNVLQSEICHHEHLLKAINKVIQDEHGYIKSSDEESLKTIEKWLLEF